MTLLKTLLILLATTFLLANDPVGTWVCDIPNQEGGTDPYALMLQTEVGQKLEAQFVSFVNSGQLSGTYEKGSSQLKLSGKSATGDKVAIELTIKGDTLKGMLHLPDLGMKLPFAGKRSQIEGTAAIGMYQVSVTPLKPASVKRHDLPKTMEKQVIARTKKAIEKWAMVGLSVALIRQGDLVDVRSYGWENHRGQVPATSKTMYRWASIAKSLTATIAMKLVQEGSLDLDKDVRSYVPEFPEQSGVITSRQLLNHTSGVVHYHRGKVLPTKRDYAEANPFGNVIHALDKFNQSQLLFAPGTDFSYSTPGYVLLGAVLQRAGKKPFAELIQEHIAKPLNLASLQPDHAWVTIPNRSVGYLKIAPNMAVNMDERTVSWKLPAGGLISTITDLAGFAKGILDGRLLPETAWQTMWQPTKLPGNRESNYGFGFNMGTMHDRNMVWHSGAQNKTATFMLLCPEAKAGVVLMCNTQGTRLEKLGEDLMGLILE